MAGNVIASAKELPMNLPGPGYADDTCDLDHDSSETFQTHQVCSRPQDSCSGTIHRDHRKQGKRMEKEKAETFHVQPNSRITMGSDDESRFSGCIMPDMASSGQRPERLNTQVLVDSIPALIHTAR